MSYRGDLCITEYRIVMRSCLGMSLYLLEAANNSQLSFPVEDEHRVIGGQSGCVSRAVFAVPSAYGVLHSLQLVFPRRGMSALAQELTLICWCDY